MEQSISVMTAAIKEILTDNLLALYVYGSCTTADYQPGWSDIDILCLTKAELSPPQAKALLNLRQTLTDFHPRPPCYRAFEGGFLTLKQLLNNAGGTVVYWGTSGQRITDSYCWDAFSRLQLLDYGRLLTGKEVRGQIPRPERKELHDAVVSHYETIREYASQTGKSLYTAGWMLDIARCLYTLQTGGIIAKTEAGRWALRQKLAPDPAAMERVLDIRTHPREALADDETMEWLAALTPAIHRFADVLEQQIKNASAL
ncbi:DUF4111 domain-containing protein [Ruminococcaceae bacterium OttesenSCG-928-L11]|nr:DUF4111 domain-containing protein [Ruminococcaceae bacterium OttesenSCG-928-L11]